MNEFKNLIKGTTGFILLSILILLGLHFAAGEMGAGSAGFNLSAPFLVLQAATVVSCYIAWYLRVNRAAADMMDIAEMRKMALGLVAHYMVISIAITAVAGVLALIVLIFDLLRIGIPAIYSYSAVFSMFILGNMALILLMRIMLPNRITGSY